MPIDHDEDADTDPVTDTDEMLMAMTDNAVQADPDDPKPPRRASDRYPDDSKGSVYENVPSTGYVGMPLQGLIETTSAGDELANRNVIGGPDGALFVFAEDNDDSTDEDYYDAMLRDDADEGGLDDEDKLGQLALMPVTHLDFEYGKNVYTIEVSDPDAEIDVSVFRVVITVMDVNEAPTAPSELRGLRRC